MENELQPTATAGEFNKKLVVAALIAGGGTLGVVGSFMTWLQASIVLIGGISVSGVDNGGDGWISVGLGVVLAILGYWLYASEKAVAGFLGIVAAVLMLWLGIYEWNRVRGFNADHPSVHKVAVVTAGPGIYVVLIGAVAAFVGSVVAVRSYNR